MFEERFLKLLPSSCKKIFFISLSLFFSTKRVNPLKVSLNCCVLIVGKKEFRLSLLKSCLDLFKANGVKKIDRIICKSTTAKEDKKIKFNKSNFLTPEVHKITNSLS